jgi:hypothetical protein
VATDPEGLPWTAERIAHMLEIPIEEARKMAAAPDLLAALRECEWRGGGPEDTEHFYCPVCKAHDEDCEKILHADNCKLAFAIARAEGKA